jgi:hypothetical protein
LLLHQWKQNLSLVWVLQKLPSTYDLSFGSLTAHRSNLCNYIWLDNEAAIAMINEHKPTTCSCHIDIQHLAIQEWHQCGDIIMHHIPGIINPSNQATKAFGWTLHSQHGSRSMGQYQPE